MEDRIEVIRYESPVGELLVGAYSERLCLCDWSANRHRQTTDRRLQHLTKATIVEAPSETTRNAIAQLEEYFAGQRRRFDIDVMMCGTDFQNQVWSAIMQIQYGTTTTYASLAQHIGRPTAVRAVANAVGSNPISIIVPCHRVVGSDNRLTGYAGGITAKQALLTFEAEPVLSTTRPGQGIIDAPAW